MPGAKGQKAVHACMIRLLNLGPAKHEEGVICVVNQRIPNVCRIAGAACCGAIRGHHDIDLQIEDGTYRKKKEVPKTGRNALKGKSFE